MDGLQAAIVKVEREIDKTAAEVETAVAQGRAEDARQLRTEKEQLRTEKEQLRTKAEQLREEELIALRASGNHSCLKETVLCLTGNAMSTNFKLVLLLEAF